MVKIIFLEQFLKKAKEVVGSIMIESKNVSYGNLWKFRIGLEIEEKYTNLTQFKPTFYNTHSLERDRRYLGSSIKIYF